MCRPAQNAIGSLFHVFLGSPGEALVFSVENEEVIAVFPRVSFVRVPCEVPDSSRAPMLFARWDHRVSVRRHRSPRVRGQPAHRYHRRRPSLFVRRALQQHPPGPQGRRLHRGSLPERVLIGLRAPLLVIDDLRLNLPLESKTSSSRIPHLQCCSILPCQARHARCLWQTLCRSYHVHQAGLLPARPRQ